MEMTFPHFSARQDSDGRAQRVAMLAALTARQADSQTVRVVRQAESLGQALGDDAAQRIDYFANYASKKTPVRGAFWRKFEPEPTSEQVVYQAGSTYIKVRTVSDEGPGNSSTSRGMEH